MSHGFRSNGKKHGVVNTKVAVVEKMLDLVNYIEKYDLSSVVVLEPAAGEGAFGIEIIKRLYKSSIKFNFDFAQALTNIHLCELDSEIVNILADNINGHIDSLGRFENNVNIYQGDFLQQDLKNKFDLVIGNPPYVRNENIPELSKAIYQKSYSTFTHRSDLYIPFFEKGLNLLKDDGVLSYVCSNRWLKNQYGKKLRQLISKYFNLDFILNLESVNIFQEEVLGYPAITNIYRGRQNQTTKYFKFSTLKSFLEFKENKAATKILSLNTANWFSYSYTGEPYEKNLKSIEQQHFKIGIGVATGRDSIFIGKCFDKLIEKELLIPILKSKDVKGTEIRWEGNYLINPFDKNGQLIDLEIFPLAKSYFNKYKQDLSQRHIAKKDENKWYKTIDKIHFNLVSKPKVILPDISGNRFIHVDKGDFYPHHNLYFITGGSYTEMCLIASILMSDFVYEQLLEIGNKMNGGYPRWQSQNLRKLLLPMLKSIPNYEKDSLLSAYFNKSLTKINSILTKEKISTFQVYEGQLTLFEPATKY